TFTLTNVSDDLYGKIHIYGSDKQELGTKGTSTAGADLTYTFTSVCNGNDDNEPDDTFEDAREITSFPTSVTGTILIDAANNNDGDYEFFKVSIYDGKKVEWEVSPEASNTELHFNVYDTNKTLLGNVDGNRGQTITGSMSNTSGSESYFYIKLGAFVG